MFYDIMLVTIIFPETEADIFAVQHLIHNAKFPVFCVGNDVGLFFISCKEI